MFIKVETAGGEEEEKGTRSESHSTLFLGRPNAAAKGFARLFVPAERQHTGHTESLNQLTRRLRRPVGPTARLRSV